MVILKVGAISVFICLFWAMMGLHCYVRVFSSCSKQGLFFLQCAGFLIAAASCCTAQAVGTQ